MKFVVSILCTYLLGATSVLAESRKAFTSGVQQTHLLELYSTQSCSSCPPAQKWVSTLKTEKQLWKSFVPVVLHVDYWDHLGWKDPYSKKEYTQRQRDYARRWKSSRIYTPMFVLNGKEWSVRSQRTLDISGEKIGVLKATQQGPLTFDVEFAPLKPETTPLEISGTLLANNVLTKVKSGENGGKALAHDFLSLELKNTSAKRVANTYQSRFTFSTPPKDVKALSVSFWVSQKNGPPLQAVGGPLTGELK